MTKMNFRCSACYSETSMDYNETHCTVGIYEFHHYCHVCEYSEMFDLNDYSLGDNPIPPTKRETWYEAFYSKWEKETGIAWEDFLVKCDELEIKSYKETWSGKVARSRVCNNSPLTTVNEVTESVFRAIRDDVKGGNSLWVFKHLIHTLIPFFDMTV